MPPGGISQLLSCKRAERTYSPTPSTGAASSKVLSTKSTHRTMSSWACGYAAYILANDSQPRFILWGNNDRWDACRSVGVGLGCTWSTWTFPLVRRRPPIDEHPVCRTCHICAGTRPHLRRDSPTSAPGLAHISAGRRQTSRVACRVWEGEEGRVSPMGWRSPGADVASPGAEAAAGSLRTSTPEFRLTWPTLLWLSSISRMLGWSVRDSASIEQA